jgi:hypothetical protein
MFVNTNKSAFTGRDSLSNEQASPERPGPSSRMPIKRNLTIG